MVPETCPNCGADVPPRAKACPECGACDQTGWSAEAGEGGLGLPDPDFQYEEFVQREFGPEPRRTSGVKWHWWVVSLAMAGLLLWFVLR
jgi:hypothetical protein